MNAYIPPCNEIVCPTSREEVATAVAEAAAGSTPVYPQGGKTALDYGVRVERPGIGMELGGLGRLMDYPARDLTITVEAGMTLETLARTLAENRQRLPVDLPQADRATVGGAIACNPSGSRRFRHGTLRDFVLGLEAVDGQGRLFRAGGRVVKNAAGYNVTRLVTGSLGRLGIVTQATLMVRPLPEKTALLGCRLPNFETAVRFLAGMNQTETVPLAIDWLVGPAWGDLPGIESRSGNSDMAGWLVVGFEGTASEVDWMVETLERQWRQNTRPGEPVSIVQLEASQSDPFWRRLRDFTIIEEDDPARKSTWILQMGVDPNETVSLVQKLVEIDPTCSVQSHAANGIVKVRFDRVGETFLELLELELRPAVEERGGVMTLLAYPPGPILDAKTVWGPSSDAIRLMRAVQAKFDPHQILNPGRFL